MLIIQNRTTNDRDACESVAEYSIRSKFLILEESGT